MCLSFRELKESNPSVGGCFAHREQWQVDKSEES